MTTGDSFGRPVEILLVEDNPGDVRLTQESLREARVTNRLNVVTDGISAMQYLRRQGEYADSPRPDVILLDLNLPGRSGREVLNEIKQDDHLGGIPVVILTTSENEMDIVECYRLKANCYVTKPVEFDEFVKIVQDLERFWFTIVQLPSTVGTTK
jgi:two-component system response regulator